MNIIIIQDTGLNESLALTELVGFLEPHGFSFRLLLVKEENDLTAEIKSITPDLFLIPADIGGHHAFHSFIKQLKTIFSLPVITGGSYPTFFPEEVIQDPNVDYLIQGEAEIPLLNLLNCLKSQKDPSSIPGIWGRNGKYIFRNCSGEIVENLDEIPLPKREIYYDYPFIKNFGSKKFVTGRGCINNCSFCYNSNLKELYPKHFSLLRKKSVNRVIEEISLVKNMTPLNHIHFSDDYFITDKKWLIDFSEIFPKKIGLPFSCNLPVRHLEPENIDLIKKAGCHGVAVGIESGCEKIRMNLLGKSFSNNELKERVLYLKKNKIMLITSNMISLPGETLEDASETLKLNQQIKTDHARFYLTFVSPKTNLAEKALKMGLMPSIPSIKEMSDISCQKAEDSKNIFFQLRWIFTFLVHFPSLNFLFKSKILKKICKFQKFAELLAIYAEKKFFRITWFSGIRMFIHSGGPYNRTKNLPSLI